MYIKQLFLWLKHDIDVWINYISELQSLIIFSQISEEFIKPLKEPLNDYQKLILQKHKQSISTMGCIYGKLRESYRTKWKKNTKYTNQIY